TPVPRDPTIEHGGASIDQGPKQDGPKQDGAQGSLKTFGKQVAGALRILERQPKMQYQ
ncbi:hypothetical protein U1Q18_009404, partial [Sarracenia purpurea var. burkii]